MSRARRGAWLLLAALLVALDVYVITYRWADVVGNVEAEFLIVTPAFVAQHLALRRHVDRRHAETVQRLDATHEQVADIHRQLTD